MKNSQNIENFYLIQSQEIGAFKKFKNEVKKSTFSILFVLLKDEEDIKNIIFFAVPVIIDYLQILNFVFDDKIKHLWNSNALFQSVIGIFSFFDISKFYGGVITWNVYVIFFYILIAIILFIILDIIYVSISFQRKKFSAIWPLIILRNFVNLAVTLLFLFITETLLSMIQCPFDEARQGYFHDSFENMECFVGFHLFHTIVSVLFNLIFVLISLIVALNYYESRISSKNKLARSNSRADVSFIINKICLQIFFNFFYEEWLLIGIIFLGGCVIAYYYIYDDPFYNKTIGNLYKILSSLYLWTCFVVLLLKILGNTNFQGGIILWISPMPFIIFVSISFSRHSLKTLLKSQVKFESAQNLTDHLNFIIQLIEQQNTDKNSYLLLVGYIQKHKEICPEIDCPLKSNMAKMKKNDFTDFNEILSRLIQVINRRYNQGIKKFKNSVTLRIAYAFFLLERLNDKKRALEELTIAENLKPSFDEEFLIYRYKKIIEDNLNDLSAKEENQEHEVDVVGIIAFETHLKTCVHFVKKAAEFHKDFWNELLEEKPSLARLKSIGRNINFTIRNAKENWYKLIKLNSNMPSVFKLYGKFLSNILNDGESGRKYMEEFHKLVIKRYGGKEGKSIDYDNLQDTSAIMFAGFQQNELGYIKKINKEFTTMFKFNEEESLNQKIEIIMPQLYKTVHEEYLNNYIENNGDNQTQYFSQENNIFGKNKIGFIFQILSQVKPYLPDNLSNSNLLFFNILKCYNKNKQKVFLMTNKNGVILDMTSNATVLLPLSLEKITERRININNFLPKALVLHTYRTKGVEKVFMTNQQQQIHCRCFVKPILMKDVSPEREQDNVKSLNGFMIVIEILKNKISNSNAIKKLRVENYEINQLLNTNAYHYFEEDAPQIELQRKNLQNIYSKNYLSMKDINQDGKNCFKIITKRLHKGDIRELYEKKFYFNLQEQKNDSEFIELNIRKSVFKDKLKNLRKQQISSNKKTRKNLLKKIIHREEKNSLMRLYKIFAFIGVILLISINSMKLVKTFNNQKEISNKIGVIYKISDINNKISDLIINIQNTEYIFRGMSTQKQSTEDLEIQMNENIAQVNNSVKEIQQTLNSLTFLEQSHISNIIERIDENLQKFQKREKDTPSIQESSVVEQSGRRLQTEQKFYQNSNYNYLENVGEQFHMFTNSINLKQLHPKTDFYQMVLYHDFRINDSLSFYLNFVNQNVKKNKQVLIDLKILKDKIFNGFLFELLNEGVFLMNSFSAAYNGKFVSDRLIFILTAIDIFFALGFFVFFQYLIKVVHKKTEQILMLFLDIPRKNLLSIHRKCETFLNFCIKFTLEKTQQKKLILLSSDEEDEFDKFINKQLNKIKHTNTQRTNYYFYLVSRQSIVNIFRKSKSKEIKTVLFIFLMTFAGIIFGFISMVDFSNINQQVIRNTAFLFEFKKSISKFKSPIQNLFFSSKITATR